eukprot:g14720.t2
MNVRVLATFSPFSPPLQGGSRLCGTPSRASAAKMAAAPCGCATSSGAPRGFMRLCAGSKASTSAPVLRPRARREPRRDPGGTSDAARLARSSTLTAVLLGMELEEDEVEVEATETEAEKESGAELQNARAAERAAERAAPSAGASDSAEACDPRSGSREPQKELVKETAEEGAPARPPEAAPQDLAPASTEASAAETCMSAAEMVETSVRARMEQLMREILEELSIHLVEGGRHETTDRFQELSFQHLVVRHRRGYDFGALSCAQLKLEVKAEGEALVASTDGEVYWPFKEFILKLQDRFCSRGKGYFHLELKKCYTHATSIEEERKSERNHVHRSAVDPAGGGEVRRAGVSTARGRGEAAAISACEKGGQWPEALKLFEAMPETKVQPDVISYSAAISACEKCGQWPQALKLFHAMPKAKVQPNVISHNAAISACEKGGQWQQAIKLFEAMPEERVQPDAISYNAAISACEKGGNWPEALKLLEAMPNVKVQPNVISYNAAISACEKGGQWQQALKLFDTMPMAKVQPDVISCSAAISACEKGGQWQQALNLFEAMPNLNVQPNMITYNAAISACEKGGQTQQALKLLEAMPEVKVLPDVISYNAAISACEKGGRWSEALKLFEAMPKVKVQPNLISYNSAISACEKGGQWQQALKLFDVIPKLMVQPNIISYNAGISACEKGGQWQQALNVFEAMSIVKVQPDVISYNAAISACEKGGQWPEALKLFESMPKVKVQPDVISYSAAISACDRGEQWQQALKLFEAMPEVKLQPNVISYSAAISACEKCGQWQQALKLFDTMSKADVQSNVISYNAAITACEKGGQWQEALKLFEAMLEANVQQDVISFCVAINACEKGRRLPQALNLLQGLELQAGLLSKNPAWSGNSQSPGAGARGEERSERIRALGVRGTPPGEQRMDVVRSHSFRKGNAGRAWKHLGQLQLDARDFTMGISSCAKSKLWVEALQLFDSLPVARVAPNVFCFGAALSRCPTYPAKAGEWQQALHFLEYMDTVAVEPSIISYNAAISACEKANHWRQALELFTLASTQTRLAGDVVGVNAALSACAKAAAQTQALSLFRAMPQMKLLPEPWQHCSTAASKPRSATRVGHGRWSFCGRWHGRRCFPMSFASTQPSVLARKLANGHSVECQRPRRAELEHLLSSKPWRGKWQFQCSHSPAASLLQPGLPFAGLLVVLGLVCLREQSKEIRRRTLRRVREERSARSNGRRKMSNDSEVADRLALSLLDELGRRRTASVVSYSAAISALRSAPSGVERARVLFDAMQGARVQPNVVSCSDDMARCGHQWQAALSFFERMRLESIRPDVTCFNAAISCCEKALQWQQSLELLAAMASFRVASDSISLSAAMSACTRSSRWSAALYLFTATLPCAPCARSAQCAACAVRAAESCVRAAPEMLEMLQVTSGTRGPSTRGQVTVKVAPRKDSLVKTPRGDFRSKVDQKGVDPSIPTGLAAAAASAAAAAEGLTPNAQNGHQGRVGDEENLEEDSRCRGPLESAASGLLSRNASSTAGSCVLQGTSTGGAMPTAVPPLPGASTAPASPLRREVRGNGLGLAW